MTRGEVWWHEPPDLKRRPALILTRDQTIDAVHDVIAIPATGTIRGIDTEVELGPDEGMPRSCVLSLDNTLSAVIDRDELDVLVDAAGADVAGVAVLDAAVPKHRRGRAKSGRTARCPRGRPRSSPVPAASRRPAVPRPQAPTPPRSGQAPRSSRPSRLDHYLPTRPTAPPGRAMPIAVAVDCSRPTHSSTEWAPNPQTTTARTSGRPPKLTVAGAHVFRGLPYGRQRPELPSAWYPVSGASSSSRLGKRKTIAAPSRIAAIPARVGPLVAL